MRFISSYYSLCTINDMNLRLMKLIPYIFNI